MSLVLNAGLMVLLLVFIKFNAHPEKDDFAVKMMEMDEVPLEEIEVMEDIIENQVVEDVEVTDMIVMDAIDMQMDTSFPEDTTLASDIASPVSLKGLVAKSGGVSLGAIDGGMTRQTSFMGQSAEGARFAFVIDYSKSMSKDQLKVMKHELYSAVKKIGEGGLVSLIFFSGPVWRPDQDGVNRDAKSGAFARWGGSNGKGWYLKEGAEGPTPKWLIPNNRNLAALERLIYQTPTTYGTDWYPPLKEALSIRPAPDIIFFMTDGACPAGSITRTLEMVDDLPPKSVTINTVVLGIDESKATALKDIAEMTGGSFRHYGNQELKDVANALPAEPDDFKDFELTYLDGAQVQTHQSRTSTPLPPAVEEDLVEFDL